MRSVLFRALSFALLAACSEPTAEPGGPQFELVNTAHRLDAASVNAHAYGSFRVGVGSGASTVITSGPANFPGHPPAGPGTCVNGQWLNPQGKPTSGTLTKPHPHCLKAAPSVDQAPCLNRVITARYDPLPAPDGIGSVDYAVEGFLWFAPASAPYNYDAGP